MCICGVRFQLQNKKYITWVKTTTTTKESQPQQRTKIISHSYFWAKWNENNN